MTETIQIVLDTKLRKAADNAARKKKMNRSALVRDALQDYLKRMQFAEMVEQELRGYRAIPQTEEEIHMWEGVEAWPGD